MAQIFDNNNNKIIWLDNKNKYYLKRDMPESEKIFTDSKENQTEDPCEQFEDAECVFLKKTTMNGRDAGKWLITLDNNGQDYHIFQWIDNKYKNILRQENSDGSGLSVFIDEGMKMNGRKVRKLTMTVFNASGMLQQATQWYDNELDIVIKQQYQDDIVDELRNIRVRKVDENLFVIPENYTLFNAAVKTVQNQGNRSSDGN
jgi:hypothetical protein